MKRLSLPLFIAALIWISVRPPVAQGQSSPPNAVAAAASGDPGGTYFGHIPDPRKTRHYYVAAEPVLWDFVPAGRDEICGLTLPSAVAMNRQDRKLHYVQYTDATFTTKAPANASLGILGPALRGVVGDYLAVTFLNRTEQALSMHPHGVKYDKDSEGAFYQPSPGKGAAVAPGTRFTYVWYLDENSGPLPSEPSSKGWLYHSHVHDGDETNQGLIGVIIVTDPKRARADGTPADVDREFATLFMIFDETGQLTGPGNASATALPPGDALKSLLLAEAANSNPPPQASPKDPDASEVNERYAINGRIYGNLPGLEMNEGERTRWYLFALGSESDFHTPHWHGERVLEGGVRRTDVVELLPATMKVADLVADNPGNWLFHCHVSEHMTSGMFAQFVIYPRDAVGADRSPEHAFLGMLPPR
jgi:FtsP/CotA-like multicopper oxidase with cupredoxin domain